MGEAVAGAIVSYAGLTGTSAVIAEVVLAAAINAGIAYGANALLMPRPEFGDREREFASANVTNPHDVILGRARTYGTVVGEHSFHEWDSSRKPQQLARMIVLAGHKCAEIESLMIDGETLAWNKVDGASWAGPNQGAITSSPYNKSYTSRGTDVASRLMVSHGLGGEDQVADAMMLALAGDYWTPEHRLQGRTYIGFVMKSDSSVFEVGAPNVGAVIKGLEVHDPRDPNSDPVDPATWSWTDNLILLAAHFERSIYGPRQNLVAHLPGKVAPPAETDWAQIADGADICDEIVPTVNGGSEKRYRLSAVIQASEDPQTVLGRILGSAAGWHARPGGVFRAWPGAYYPPVQGFSLNETDFVGPTEFPYRTSSADRAGGIRGEFISEDDNWRRVAYPEVVQPDLPGAPRMLDLNQPLTPSPYQAQRVARIVLRQRRRGEGCNGALNMKGMAIAPGDVVPITFEPEGLEAVPHLISTWALTEEPETGRLASDITSTAHVESDFADPDAATPLTEYVSEDSDTVSGNQIPPGQVGEISIGVI
ncbi:MAG: phage tail protein [Henriciella sp.]|nr:phage tail protein [Henriciella sp.]